MRFVTIHNSIVQRLTLVGAVLHAQILIYKN